MAQATSQAYRDLGSPMRPDGRFWSTPRRGHRLRRTCFGEIDRGGPRVLLVVSNKAAIGGAESRCGSGCLPSAMDLRNGTSDLPVFEK